MKKNVLVIGKNMSLNEMLSRQYLTFWEKTSVYAGLRAYKLEINMILTWMAKKGISFEYFVMENEKKIEY